MPLKDYKEEIRCVTSIAGLLQHQAIVNSRATMNVAYALKGVIKKREDAEIEAEIFDKSGVVWSAW